MPSNKDKREYRSFALLAEESEQNEKQYLVRGYASTLEPYVLWEEDGIKYWEKIDRHAFDEADMTDVLFLFNHEGMVFARSKNGTVHLAVDDHGLFQESDLGSTTQSRPVSYTHLRAHET